MAVQPPVVVELPLLLLLSQILLVEYLYAIPEGLGIVYSQKGILSLL